MQNSFTILKKEKKSLPKTSKLVRDEDWGMGNGEKKSYNNGANANGNDNSDNNAELDVKCQL